MECKIDTEKSEMVRKAMMQQLFSDIEYKNRQKLMGIDFMQEQMLVTTMLLHFRWLIEKSGLSKVFF